MHQSFRNGFEKQSAYDPPLKGLPKHLQKDPVHSWRARTGTELIHKEPNPEELERIHANWQEMSKTQQRISDRKSKQLFGMTNEDHYNQLRGPKYVYHASPNKMDIIHPSDIHGDPDAGSLVFATPHKNMAAAYTGQKWGDRDINQCGKKGRYILEEMRPGAFADVFTKKKGYLYKLPAEEFHHIPHRGVNGEVVSDHSVRPTDVEVIHSPFQFLQEQGVILKHYNPDAQSHKDAISRMKIRMRQMPDKGAGYLDWVSEKNPRLANQLVLS